MNEEELKHRLKTAIILLTDGHSFKVGDLTFSSNYSNHLLITGWTLSNGLENVTKEKALTELNEIKELFKQMLAVSPELADFIKNREIEYCLGYEYGMGGLEICNETNGKIKWTTTLEK
jgi:hypothetical protein